MSGNAALFPKLPQFPEPPWAPVVGTGPRRNPLMANQPNPDNPYRFSMTDDGIRRQTGLDNELQPDPELADAPASGGRVAMLAVAVAVALGAVFYGLNNAPVHQAGTASTAQNAAPEAPLVA